MKSRLVQSRAANRKEAMSYWVDVVGTKVDLLILIVIEGMRNKDICGPHSQNREVKSVRRLKLRTVPGILQELFSWTICINAEKALEKAEPACQKQRLKPFLNRREVSFDKNICTTDHAGVPC